MALEIIKNIANAEQEADTIKNNALQEAEQIKADADTKSIEIFEEKKQEGKTEAVQLIQNAINSVQPEVERILSESEQLCGNICTKAKENMESAIEAVIRKVVGTNGNS